MSEKSASISRTGQCFCGSVKFIVSGPPINVRACHCRDCQRLSGSAFFVRALFLKEHVQIAGEVTGFASSNDLVRKFCPRCGSQIFAERKSRPDAIAIALGAFDQLDGIFPTEHVWVSDRQEWLLIPAGVQQHRETP